MGASRVAGDIAVGFEWTLFSHGFVFLEHPNPERLPPVGEAGQREWLAGATGSLCNPGPTLRQSV